MVNIERNAATHRRMQFQEGVKTCIEKLMGLVDGKAKYGEMVFEIFGLFMFVHSALVWLGRQLYNYVIDYVVWICLDMFG